MVENRLEPGLSASKCPFLSTKSLLLLIPYIYRQLHGFQTTFIFIILFDPSKQQCEIGRAHTIVYIFADKAFIKDDGKSSYCHSDVFLHT